MGLAFILAAVTLSAEPAPAAGTIPPEKRVDYVNRSADRLKGPNAWKHYRRADDAFVWIGELADEADDADWANAVREVEMNSHVLETAPAWSEAHAEVIEDWLTANEKVLKAIKKATRYTRCHVPVDGRNERFHRVANTAIPTELLYLSTLMAIKANDCARRGRWKEAYQWNVRMHRLSSHLQQLPFRGKHGMATRPEREAAALFLALLGRHYRDDAPKFLERARALDEHRCPDAVIDEVEALRARDYVEACHEWAEDSTRHPDLGESFSSRRAWDNSRLPQNVYRASPHTSLDDLRTAIRNNSVEQELAVAKKLDVLRSEWNARPFHQAWKQRDAFLASYCETMQTAPGLSAEGCSFIDTYQAAMYRELTNLHRTAVDCVVAIHEFRKANGHLPKSLADLVPDFAKTPHIDSFSGKPLIYHATSDGDDFTLHSVYLNQVDNGGLHAPGVEPGGDFVFWPPPLRKITALEP